MGHFGWNPGSPPQMRWRAVVDLDVALPAVQDILSRWWVVRQWPDAPPFSGGVLDAWPSRLADGLALCRTEWAAVLAAVTGDSKEAHGG